MRCLLSSVALIASFSASAAEIEANSKIVSVTLFPSNALITRSIEVELSPGKTSLVFRNLPIGLDPASLQVAGEATQEILLGSVTSRVTRADPKPDNDIETHLKQLQLQRGEIQVTLETLEAERAMMLRYSQASPEKLGPDAKPLDVDSWSKAWDIVATGLGKVADQLRLADKTARELDEAITTIDITRSRPPTKSSAGREVSVEAEAKTATKARISLTYRISGASWRPLYEARLKTGAGGKQPNLEFFRRAAISQTTGEDWSNVDLTVSTIRADHRANVPDLAPQNISLRDIPSPLPAAGSANVSPTTQRVPAAMATMKPAAPSDVANSPQERQSEAAQDQPATIEASAFTAVFKIAGPTSLASDGTVKTAPISKQNAAPDLMIKTVPALDPTAYLVDHLANDSDTPLLPGSVMLYRDGTYIGTGSINFVAAGDTFDLSFGADDRVKVARVPLRRKQSEPYWYSQTRTDTREFRTIIENLHDFPVKITLADALPFSENSAITVEQLPATTPPSDTTVENKRGILNWTYQYAPREKRDVLFSYKLKWPADREVVIEPAPLPAK